jgi:hypothetical protein
MTSSSPVRRKASRELMHNKTNTWYSLAGVYETKATQNLPLEKVDYRLP